METDENLCSFDIAKSIGNNFIPIQFYHVKLLLVQVVHKYVLPEAMKEYSPWSNKGLAGSTRLHISIFYLKVDILPEVMRD